MKTKAVTVPVPDVVPDSEPQIFLCNRKIFVGEAVKIFWVKPETELIDFSIWATTELNLAFQMALVKFLINSEVKFSQAC